MKLSDIKGDRVFDVIADLIEPVSNIAQDKDITLFKKEPLPDGESSREFALQKISKNVPKLLKKHKKDISIILATIKGQPVKQYLQELDLARLTIDILELLNDNDFVNFFTSAMQTEE